MDLKAWLGFGRRKGREIPVERLYGAVVAASRHPALYEIHGLPDTLDGRFESLVLHGLVVLRRLRALPAPAQDVAQDLVDAVFAHLEIAMRESGIGDFGVPKRMKKLGTGFYDRLTAYEAALDAGPDALAAALGDRLGLPDGLGSFAREIVAAEARLATCDLAAILAAPPLRSGTTRENAA